MIKNFKITIEYDGSQYHGWQRQRDDRTIQGEIEKVLKIITGTKITLTGSGRTDAGVHAEGQVANFRCHTKLGPEEFQNGLNSLLPEDVIIKACDRADESFHARYDAKSKIYHYKILNRLIPAAIGRQYVWFIRKKLNLEAMRSAISNIIGLHDFGAFEGTGSPGKHRTRSVLAADLVEHEKGLLTFRIEADGFLRFMVRNIVGTLVEVGLNKLTVDDFKRIMESKDRSQASATAPARGLYLMEVKYDKRNYKNAGFQKS